MFIVFEGPDFSGKTTVIDKLKDYVREKYPNKKFYFTREPGGTNLPVCEKIRKILLDPDIKMDDLTESYLYAAGRAEHCKEIKKHLDNNEIVICDRFVYSSYIYQGLGKELSIQTVEDINSAAISELTVNLIFKFNIDLKTFLARKNKDIELDRLEQNDISFFEKVLEGYDNMCGNIVINIDATKPKEEVFNEVIKYLIL